MMVIKDLVAEFHYLDRLRESGRTNMWGAPAYQERERKLTKDEAFYVHGLWMKTLTDNPEGTAEERAAAAEASERPS